MENPYAYGGYWPASYTQPQVTKSAVSTSVTAGTASLASASTVTTVSSFNQRSVTVTVKVINPDKKSEYKTFLIRNIDVDNLNDVNDIRSMLKEELGDQYLPKGLNFDIGFYKGNKQVWMRNDKDAEEVLRNLRMKYECTLWCSGKTDKQKAKKRPTEGEADASSDSDSEQERTRKKKKKPSKRKTMQEEKRERTEHIVDDLVDKHGTKYTHLQYRVWAETVVARRYDSLDEPPKGTFFRAKVTRKSSCIPVNPSAQLPSSSASPPKESNPVPPVLTAGKSAQLRSTYIQQIKELHELLEIGAIAQEDFSAQRDRLLQHVELTVSMHNFPENFHTRIVQYYWA